MPKVTLLRLLGEGFMGNFVNHTERKTVKKRFHLRYQSLPSRQLTTSPSTFPSILPSNLHIPSHYPPLHHNPKTTQVMARKAKPRKPARKAIAKKPAKRTSAKAAPATSAPVNSNNKRTLKATSAQPPKKLKGTNTGLSAPSPLSLLSSLGTATPSYLPSIRTPQHTMSDVVGLDAVKKEIMDSIVTPFALDDAKAKLLNINRPKGILLLGPPGCGKTIIADAIVNAIKSAGKDVNFYQESGGCLSQWLGESERNIRSVFAFAEANCPAVIFMDELDGLGYKRENSPNGASTSTRITTLLTEINNITPGNVLLIAATNCKSQVDPALMRPGRFDVCLEIPLPNDQGRSQILQHYVGKKQMQIEAADMRRIVQETGNWSGAKLETFVNRLHVSRLMKACPDLTTMSVTQLKKVLPSALKLDLNRDVLPLIAMMREH